MVVAPRGGQRRCFVALGVVRYLLKIISTSFCRRFLLQSRSPQIDPFRAAFQGGLRRCKIRITLKINMDYADLKKKIPPLFGLFHCKSPHNISCIECYTSIQINPSCHNFKSGLPPALLNINRDYDIDLQLPTSPEAKMFLIFPFWR